MDDKGTLIAKLIIFLEKNEAYEKFIDNLYNYHDIDSLCDYEIKCLTPEDSICDAFSRSDTPEGDNYWSMLSESFTNEYDSLPTERPEIDIQLDKMWEK